MAISVQIYSNANSSSKSISFDFVGDILAASDLPANNTSTAFLTSYLLNPIKKS